MARLWSAVNVGTQKECWTCYRDLDSDGYPRLQIKGRKYRCSRIVAVLFGVIKSMRSPELVCHKCDNPQCLNPYHLWAGSIDTNNKDKANKGRSPRGERHGKALLTEAQVREARRVIPSGIVPCARLAAQWNVSKATIWDAVSGRTWSYLE